MINFKKGDNVYIPLVSTQILTLIKGNKSFPLKVKVKVNNNVYTFTQDGKYVENDPFPRMFYATKENHKLLETLHNTKFEEPKSFLDTHLELGSKVLCLTTSDETSLPKYIWDTNTTKSVQVVTSKKGGNYYTENDKLISRGYLYPISIDDKGKIKYLD